MPKRSPQRRLEDAILRADIGIDLDSWQFKSADITPEAWMVDSLRNAETSARS
jgi:hypothetical protein